MSRLTILNPNASTVSSTSLYTAKYPISPTEIHAAVIIPLCNLNDNSGLLLEVSGGCEHIPEKLGAHVFVLSIALQPRRSVFPGGEVSPTDESILHAALREAKEGVGIDEGKIEILRRLGPPTQSLSGLRVWPYRVVSSQPCVRVSVK